MKQIGQNKIWAAILPNRRSQGSSSGQHPSGGGRHIAGLDLINQQTHFQHIVNHLVVITAVSLCFNIMPLPVPLLHKPHPIELTSSLTCSQPITWCQGVVCSTTQTIYPAGDATSSQSITSCVMQQPSLPSPPKKPPSHSNTKPPNNLDDMGKDRRVYRQHSRRRSTNQASRSAYCISMCDEMMCSARNGQLAIQILTNCIAPLLHPLSTNNK